MTFDNIYSKQHSSASIEQQPALSLLSLSEDKIRQITNRGNQDSTNGPTDPPQVARDGRFFCAAPGDNPEAKKDQKIKDTFGTDVFDNLKNPGWLRDNMKKLEDGFDKLSGQEKWDIAWRMNELSKVGGKPSIYLSKTEGQPAGNLREKRYDIYLRSGPLHIGGDYEIGRVYH